MNEFGKNKIENIVSKNQTCNSNLSERKYTKSYLNII